MSGIPFSYYCRVLSEGGYPAVALRIDAKTDLEALTAALLIDGDYPDGAWLELYQGKRLVYARRGSVRPKRVVQDSPRRSGDQRQDDDPAIIEALGAIPA